MKYEDNPKSIKFFVKRFILNNKDLLKGKTTIDFPAGNGVSTQILREIGAKPIPIDLFPEYFKVKGMDCLRANINKGLPLEDAYSDFLICQEGIEHFSDQFLALKEFNRVLKKNGTLLITTPNYSNLRAKCSYLLSESERCNSIMPPNELDSIWMSNKNITNEIYFGHIFLIGVQKLRVLSVLAGFEIKKIHFTRIKTSSLLLFPLLYPFILVSNFITYRKNIQKKSDIDIATKKQIYRNIFTLSINPKVLVDGHLMVEFIKVKETIEVADHLRSSHKDFGTT